MEISLLTIAALLLFSSRPHAALLDSRFLPDSSISAFAGVALTVAGGAVAIVARAFLGRNWSGRPTLKEGHELVRNGPYAFVRHPIYTGLLVSAIGSAIALGHVRNLLALPLVLLGFWLKLRAEEDLLLQAFGNEYLAYRRSVKSTIIPFIL
jgi:protein-S-isoprenylcysteine O-methyltransferase Ste14